MSGLFQVGDLVFAKIRGYCPWPARVEGTFLETPKLRKYSVFFFGTSQRGVCSENNVFPYAQTKAKYGRPIKIRGFQQALEEIKEAASFLDNPKDHGAIKQEEPEEQALCVIKTELENDLTSQTNFFVHEEKIDSEEPWLQQLKEEMENPQFSNNTWPDIEEESPEVELKASANGINAEINSIEINSEEVFLLQLKEEIEISASNKDRSLREEFTLQNTVANGINAEINNIEINTEEMVLLPLKEEIEISASNKDGFVMEEFTQQNTEASANGINAEINGIKINSEEMVVLQLKEGIEISLSNNDRSVKEELTQQNTEVKTRSREKFQEVRVEMQRLEESTDPEVRAYFTRLKMGHQLSSTLRAEDTPCEEEEDCAAATCLRPTGSQVLWVQCDGRCSKWFHFLCEGLKENDVHDEDEYICNTCRTLSISVDPPQSSSSDLAPKSVELSMDSEVDEENSSEADNFILRDCETGDTENKDNYCEPFNSEDAHGIRKEENNEDRTETKVVDGGSDLRGKYRKAKRIGKERSSLKSFSVVSQNYVIKKMSFVCETCGKLCRDNSALQHHRIVHSDERPFKCPICEKTFKRKVSLAKHKQCEQGTKKYRCAACGKFFWDNFALRQHMIVYCIGRSFKCPLPEKTFKRKQISGKREQSPLGKQETKMYQCETCGKYLRDNFSLREHRIVHTGERPYKCNLCKKTFKWKGNLVIHMQFHSGKALHKCSVCGKAFYLRWQLKVHDRIHTGEKPFECGDCGKTFTQKSTLIYHIRRHTGEKPFKCNHCDKEFVNRGFLNKHMIIHSDKLPFACKYCGKCFRLVSSISRHVSRMHGVLYSSSE